jgi:trk system potassium uptake protein TrkH
MVIGSSPSGTGGGLKCTTFSALVGVMRSAIRGEQQVRFWNRPIPVERVWVAVGSLGFYLSTLIAGTYLLDLTETSSFDQNFFEAASALGTVGLSMGITATLSDVGRLVVILLMFSGRLGPLTFGIALFARPRAVTEKGDNDLAV